jgi:hypothetical protein
MAILSLGVRASLTYAFRRPDGQLILGVIALMWLCVGMAAVLVVFFKRALLPRLNDMGFRGPSMVRASSQPILGPRVASGAEGVHSPRFAAWQLESTV